MARGVSLCECYWVWKWKGYRCNISRIISRLRIIPQFLILQSDAMDFDCSDKPCWLLHSASFHCLLTFSVLTNNGILLSSLTDWIIRMEKWTEIGILHTFFFLKIFKWYCSYCVFHFTGDRLKHVVTLLPLNVQTRCFPPFQPDTECNIKESTHGVLYINRHKDGALC